jgi:hypothetical protein
LDDLGILEFATMAGKIERDRRESLREMAIAARAAQCDEKGFKRFMDSL